MNNSSAMSGAISAYSNDLIDWRCGSTVALGVAATIPLTDGHIQRAITMGDLSGALLDAIMDRLYGQNCGKAVVACEHCGQWGARYCSCKHCGAPVGSGQ